MTRTHIEVHARQLEDVGKGPATIGRRLSTAARYRYATEEGVLEYSPAVHVRRPRLGYESYTNGLDRMRYDRARQSLDRHATYIVSTFIAGSARGDTGGPPAGRR